MKIEFPSIESDLSGKNILLVTNHTNTDFAQQKMLTSYPPDTLLCYQQAGWVLGAKVLQLTFDEAIKLLSTVDKQIKHSLLINLTAGLKSIALEGIIPGLSGLHNIPVFTASILNQVIAEDKLVSKRMAIKNGLKCSMTYSASDLCNVRGPVIIKPIVGTDSIGIEKVDFTSEITRIAEGQFIEEFISGNDVTIHVLWNNSRKLYQILNCFLQGNDPDNWFDRDSKIKANLIFNDNHSSRTSISVDSMCPIFTQSIFDFLKFIGKPYIARLDFRLRHGAKQINSESMYFLEINATPTISNANDWWSGILAFDAPKKQEILINNLNEISIHPAAKSIAFLMNEFYVQSLSKHNDN